MWKTRNTIYYEMVVDLLYRLRLADDLFCHASETVLAAISLGGISGKAEAVESLRSYAKALRVIYADFLHVIKGHHIVFPAEMSLWQWNESGCDVAFVQAVERLHSIADGMEMKLSGEMVKREVRG